ncbi:MAG TPA: hypothetical protein VFN25_16255 [Dokdonella sp.]|uniref:hypothetical protein n=1 Tax=Dokdonella sp. TaxID=2291710 RepID=UPI002D80FBA3|nr:hypothetical protein [Dokdonella sp.]HET9034444.1 hypothetical protein [Dokdonella sp.]
MTERSLSKLYRSMGDQALGSDLLDADTLLAASSGSLSGDRRDEVAARLSRSPVQTDLVRLLHDLNADSAKVAQAVNSRQSLVHSRDGRRTRHAGDPRRHATQLRWAGLAAGLVLVFGFVLWHPQTDHSSDQTMAAAVKPDRIFTSQDRIFSMNDDALPTNAADNVFRSNFNGG